MSFSGLNGLTSQPVAPAALPSAFLAPSLSVVRIRIGTARCCEPARTFLIREMPSMFGMLRSVMMRSNFAVPSLPSATLPSSASSTWKPALRRVNATMSRMVFESSTARIRLLISDHPVLEFRLKTEIGQRHAKRLGGVGNSKRRSRAVVAACRGEKHLDAGRRDTIDRACIDEHRTAVETIDHVTAQSLRQDDVQDIRQAERVG